MSSYSSSGAPRANRPTGSAPSTASLTSLLAPSYRAEEFLVAVLRHISTVMPEPGSLDAVSFSSGITRLGAVRLTSGIPDYALSEPVLAVTVK